MGNRQKILLIGWDGADWKIINPLIDAGRMPALENLVNNGIIGNIATLDPVLSPMLWTSIATGKRADKHGILGFVEPDLESGTVRPVNVTSRKTRALWNILNSQGFRSNVIGWWPSHPAEPLNGIVVTDFVNKLKYASPAKQKKMLEKVFHPQSIIKELKQFLVFPEEMTEAHILPFVPFAAEINQDNDKGIAILAKLISETATIQAMATWSMENSEWDFTAVYFDSIDHFCHAFMKFHPPRLEGVPDDLFRYYSEVVQGAYVFHDMMLERLLNLAGEDALVILVSDHGFLSGRHRMLTLPDIPAAPAFEHRPYGILCAKGPGIKKDERIYGATILDITPTILTALGLPVAKDMDGKVLLDIFEDNREVSYIESWEDIPDDFGTHPDYLSEDSMGDYECIRQLIELGYIEDPGPDKNKAMKSAITEQKYNLSRVYSSSGKVAEAVEILEQLLQDNPDEVRVRLDLVYNYLTLNDTANASVMIELLRKDKKLNVSVIDLFEGILQSMLNNPLKAIDFLRKAETGGLRNPGFLNEAGRVNLQAGNYAEAERLFRKSLELDDENAPAYHGLAISMLRRGRYEEAADHALTAIALMYHFPAAHYHLGEALFHMKRYPEAAKAFEMSLNMSPMIWKAHRWLIKIFGEFLKDTERLNYHKSLIDNRMKGVIVIVSGLPRSGTSLMMQMLAAGGMDLLTDNVRQPDKNNLRGYFEYEPVKKIMTDISWLPAAEGKAMKVIAPLLPFLPSDYDYRIIFMTRNMEEIIQSQQVMLGKKRDVFPLLLAESFERELLKAEAWAKKEPNVKMIKISFPEVIQNPFEIAVKVNDFLGICLDADSMAAAVDPELYRNKL